MKNNPLLEAFFESVDSKENWIYGKYGTYESPINKIKFSIYNDFPLVLRIYHNDEHIESFTFGWFVNRKLYKYYKKMKANIKEKQLQDAFNDLPIKVKRRTKLNNINTNEYESVAE